MSVYDFSDSTAVNIDSIMDAVVKSRLESQIGGIPEEAIVDDQTGRRYRRFQKRSKQEEMIYQSIKKERENSGAISSNVSSGSFNLGSIQGLRLLDRMINGDDDEYDSAPTFICTFCSKLSRGKKYNPVVCDSCTECLSCNQFAKKECSGCEYSRWREGIPYGQLNGQSCTMDSTDLSILNEVLEEDDSDSVKFDDINITNWSVMD